MYSFVYSFIYLYMYSVEWSRRRRGNGWLLQLKTIYIASITCVSTSPQSCLLSSHFPLTSFYIYCYWIHCVIGSPVCVNWYIRFHYIRLRFSFSSPHLLSGAAIYRREDVERSESSKLAARAQRDRTVSRFSARGQSAQRFWVCLGN